MDQREVNILPAGGRDRQSVAKMFSLKCALRPLVFQVKRRILNFSIMTSSYQCMDTSSKRLVCAMLVFSEEVVLVSCSMESTSIEVGRRRSGPSHTKIELANGWEMRLHV